MTIGKPQQDEYNRYYEAYVSLVPEGDVTEHLRAQAERTAAVLRGIREEDGTYRYEPGKWSVKELIGHIVDTERVMSYRLLCVARGDTTPLPGFDQDVYVQGAGFDERPLADLIADYAAVRKATLALLAGVPEGAWTRRGNANGGVITARALAYIIAGHELHHFKLLQERYGSVLDGRS